MRFSTFPLALLLTIPGLSGCDDFTLKRFNVDEPLPESTIQGVGLKTSLPFILSSVPMDLKSQDGYDNEDFDYVTEINIESVVLTISDASDDPERDAFEDGNLDNFDFISSLEVTIIAQFGDQTRSDVVAFLGQDDPQIATSSRSLRLTTNNIDIIDYVEAQGGYEIQITGSGTVPSDNVIFGGAAGYEIGIGFN